MEDIREVFCETIVLAADKINDKIALATNGSDAEKYSKAMLKLAEAFKLVLPLPEGIVFTK